MPEIFTYSFVLSKFLFTQTDLPVSKYNQVKIAAGSGAELVLKSDNFIGLLEQLQCKLEYIELSTDTNFEMEYAMNIFFER